jgi:peptide deformylase
MRELVTAPSSILRQPCKQVKTVDSYIRALVEDMFAFLRENNTLTTRSYGISAPQLGESISVLVIDTPAIELVALNPVVTKNFGQHTWIEGCLSLPGLFYAVRRPKLIKFQYLGLDGAIHAEKAHDDYAGVYQHEIQHLSGIMIDTIGHPVSRQAIYE